EPVSRESITMDKRVTLQEAFTAWCTQPGPAGDLGTHLDFPALYALLTQPGAHRTQDADLYHLTRCPPCLPELNAMAESLRERQEDADEITDPAMAGSTMTVTTTDAYTVEVQPWAATSKNQGLTRITTPDGIWTIIIRPTLAEQTRGLITIEVSPGHHDR